VRHIRTEVEIQASDERVWQILTQLNRYAEWNPLIRDASGTVAVGQDLRLRIDPPGLLGRTFRVRVLVVVPRREFRWLGQLMFPGVLDGDHTFIIEPLGDHAVLVVQSETFSGLLVPLLGRSLVPNMRLGFEQLNRALKARAEQAG
jgi:hypothetical protein